MIEWIRATRLNWTINKTGDPLARALRYRECVKVHQEQNRHEIEFLDSRITKALEDHDYEAAAEFEREYTKAMREYHRLIRAFRVADRVVGWHGGRTEITSYMVG